MLLGQELKFKNKLCNLKLGTFFSALPGLGASALSGRVGLTCKERLSTHKEELTCKERLSTHKEELTCKERLSTNKV